MKNTIMLPHKMKKIGWIILGVVVPIGIYVIITDNQFDFLTFQFGGNKAPNKINLTNTILGCLFIIGGLIVAFSKEKIEDEFIVKIRLRSFQWAVLFNYILLFIAFVFVFGLDFLIVMIFNMFTTLILFILRFNLVVFMQKK